MKRTASIIACSALVIALVVGVVANTVPGAALAQAVHLHNIWGMIHRLRDLLDEVADVFNPSQYNIAAGAQKFEEALNLADRLTHQARNIKPSFDERLFYLGGQFCPESPSAYQGNLQEMRMRLDEIQRVADDMKSLYRQVNRVVQRFQDSEYEACSISEYGSYQRCVDEITTIEISAVDRLRTLDSQSQRLEREVTKWRNRQQAYQRIQDECAGMTGTETAEDPLGSFEEDVEALLDESLEDVRARSGGSTLPSSKIEEHRRRFSQQTDAAVAAQPRQELSFGELQALQQRGQSWSNALAGSSVATAGMNTPGNATRCAQVREQIEAYRRGISQLDLRSPTHRQQKQMWEHAIGVNQQWSNGNCP